MPTAIVTATSMPDNMPTQVSASMPATHLVLAAILSELSRKYPKDQVVATTDIWGTGLTDSQGFLDVIFDVEKETGWLCEFDSLDLDGAMTPLKMAAAFKPAVGASAAAVLVPETRLSKLRAMVRQWYESWFN